MNWDAARQVALSLATGGEAEANVDPLTRIEYESLVRVADLHVRNVTGLDTAVVGREPTILPVSPGVWAQRSLDAYRPLFEHLASALGKPAAESPDDAVDPMSNMLAGLQGLMAPTMLGLSAGSMVGHLAQRAFGLYDLPIPRPASAELLVVSKAVDNFGTDWSLPRDDLRMWVCLHELTSHAVLSVPHVHLALTELLRQFAASFRPDPQALTRSIESMVSPDPDNDSMADPQAMMAKVFGDPHALLGAVGTPEQERLAVQLDALVALVMGVIDHFVDLATTRIIGTGNAVCEAVRRRRLSVSPSDQLVERLVGLRLERTQLARGQAFVDGVIERAGTDALAPLWLSAKQLPTPAELDAPGLWLARITLPD